MMFLLLQDVSPLHDDTAMTKQQILSHPSMPVSAPSYRCGPVNFTDRHIFGVVYESDPDAIDAVVPDLLRPHASNQVVVQWVKSKSTGIGDYTKVDVFVRCCPFEGDAGHRLIAKGARTGWSPHGDYMLYHVMSFTDSSAPITFGRELMGEPQKFASPIKLDVAQDTIVGSLDYCGERVATATMAYHHRHMPVHTATALLSAPKVTLKQLPDVDGRPAIAQLVGSHHDVTKIHWAYEGHAAAHLLSHANAPLSDLPVRHVVTGFHINADLHMDRGHILHDYLEGV
jgi:acetoacetate decarboxylase